MSDRSKSFDRPALAAAASAEVAAEAPLRDWLVLLKPRVMTLVVFTGLVGLVVAPGRLHPVLAFTAVLCIAIAAGAAGAINMWYDRDIDAVMRRTRSRPIPAGRIAPEAALAYGVTLAAGSVLVMGLATNAPAAILLAGSIAFYVFVYTIWLKRRTPQNADYARAGVPMLPVVAGARETRRQIVLYTAMLVPASLLPWVCGYAGPIYGLSALALGLGFMLNAWRVLRDRQDPTGISLTSDAPAKAAFRFSILYLFVLFAALAVDRLAG